MKILIADDNNEKISDVLSKLSTIGINVDKDVSIVSNCYDAKRSLDQEYFDMLILDLAMPKSRTSKAELDGGASLLEMIAQDRVKFRPTHIIGLTSFDEALHSSESDFNKGLWSILKYTTSDQSWFEKIKSKITYIKTAAQSQVDGYDYKTDVAFVCALYDPELIEVLNLPFNWQSEDNKNDPTQYYRGVIPQENTNGLSAICCCAPEMGLVYTSTLITKVCMKYRPRLIVMTGICAGREGEVQLGDIIVANPSWDYGSGKFKSDGEETLFTPSPKQLALNSHLRKLAENLSRDGEFVDRLKRSYKAGTPVTSLTARVGPMASGAAVRADDSFFDELAQNNRKVLAVEMEAYGVFAASSEMPNPAPLPLVVKSVSDFANSAKEDSVRKYASFTSAHYAVEIVKRYFSSSD
ncbi:hypothetical protein [Thalassospira tepidiphila]|uniref:phosphorylase family protein n=1 Tax=Thalassospira tepidiphila TaxID=393657 RepID=UPI002924F51C|nr:histidine kinase [Thalassospira tepidiphila]